MSIPAHEIDRKVITTLQPALPQVFGFSTRRLDQYAGYDWGQLTTVAWNTDPALMCLAHSKGARVVLNAGVGKAGWLTNATARAAWVSVSSCWEAANKAVLFTMVAGRRCLARACGKE